MEREERAQAKRLQMELEVRRMEIEADTAVRIRKLELEAQLSNPGLHITPTKAPQPATTPAFDISKCISLMPTFRETEVDSYFVAFERIAETLQWPRGVWSLLLQCKLSGRALEVLSALPVTDSLDYDRVKAVILQAYELIPEAYRQKFRQAKKSAGQTHVEFAREISMLFDKWCSSTKIKTLSDLRELILLEDFKRKLPERLVTYLNEQKVSTLSAASLLADEFTLTHREIVRRDERKDVQPVLIKKSIKRSPQNGNPETRTCYYCHRTGHVLKDCFMLQKKNGKPTAAPKEVGFLKRSPVVKPLCAAREPDACFAPFILSGEISLTPGDADKQSVRILRDTGASQMLILSSALPFSASSSRGYAVLLQGIEMKSLPAQVHRVHLECQLVSGCFDVAICDHLPVNGVDVLLGNDVAGGKVLPLLEVVPQPQAEHVNCASDSHFYPACAVTRSQTQNNADIQLNDSVLMRLLSDDSEQIAHDGLGLVPSSDAEEQREKADADPQQGEPFPLTAETLSAAQKSDITLKPYFEQVTTSDKTDKTTTHYLLDNDVLVRCWPQPAAEGLEWGLVKQIIAPSSYREHVVSLAHESDWSGHLGVNKTYKLLLQHFFWPGMKKEVSLFCRRCHVCQMTGKPNQPIPPAPLQPIPVVSTPFDHVILDCVGPLPPSRTGKRFLLTLMCSATRFPEAIPLNSITTRSIIRALTHFFSIFGLPKVIQTDQGTNFKSKLFKQVTKTLGITHVMSSAYHPQSQGALERWHQTLKAMLTKYCLSKSKTWEEGLPFVLFAAREAVQDSLGFSPAQLVFGHTPRGPLKALKERFLFSDPP
uniref:Gypsy retrotransposon integrase-like protein 1 n=1 Tax=Nothobranchius furzeri TaxID=105023 RepID=A0A8C6LK80_NOTFU